MTEHRVGIFGESEGTIFEESSATNPHGGAVNKYLQNLDLSTRAQIQMLTEMLDAMRDENSQLQEQLLELQRELDIERKKKLQSP